MCHEQNSWNGDRQNTSSNALPQADSASNSMRFENRAQEDSETKDMIGRKLQTDIWNAMEKRSEEQNHLENNKMSYEQIIHL